MVAWAAKSAEASGSDQGNHQGSPWSGAAAELLNVFLGTTPEEATRWRNSTGKETGSAASGKATRRSATSGCITSRQVTGRWSSCCTASPSSGTAGGARSSRSRRRDSTSWHPTRAATTCRLGRKRSRPTTAISSPPTSANLIHERGARPRCWSVTTGAGPSPGPWRCTTPRSWGDWPSSTPPTRGSYRRDCTTRASSASPGTSSSSISRNYQKPSSTPTIGTSSGTSWAMRARPSRRRKPIATSRPGRSRARPPG